MQGAGLTSGRCPDPGPDGRPAGLLGISKPVEFGGMGLDYSYAIVMAEELGHIHCGSVTMAIGVFALTRERTKAFFAAVARATERAEEDS